ncbi:MAG: VWA domain-containing protein [Deltaproteobacteria bacterium]|nr:VWA domain-containing protein [Deltaproteobacteria bacterium]
MESAPAPAGRRRDAKAARQAPEAAADSAVESIVVTAHRREESIQEVPIAVESSGLEFAVPSPSIAAQPELDTEGYARIDESDFRAAATAPLSTFSIDVDTASYANVRRFLTSGELPPADAVRIEELVNYFPYEYERPQRAPFAVHVDVTEAPWRPEHKLVRIALAAREIPQAERPASNLVFLIDVSGSMQDENKLPLVKRALSLLAEQLGERDRVAIVVYAGAAGVVLEPVRGDQRHAITRAIEQLEAGGSTNGGQGIERAYALARAGHRAGVASRVVLATDGDFNVGVTSEGELTRLIEREAKSGVFLSVLGFGMGNYQDATLEQLADRGNGNYAYVDTLAEARKALVEQMTGTLLTVAKDVKIQVEWNPAQVGEYRLLGYENRALRDEDFLDDAKDAGEIGAGHTVTALYEVAPPGSGTKGGKVEPLKYQTRRAPSDAAFGGELATVKLRWKAPDAEASDGFAVTVDSAVTPLARAPEDARFAASVAAFGMLLRASEHRGGATWADTIALAESALGRDAQGYRAEFVALVRRAQALSAQHARAN